MPFASGVFEAPIVGLLFWAFSLGPPLKSQKMADLGFPRQICHFRLYGHLWSRSLQQNVALCLHFKCILIRRWCHLRPWSPLGKISENGRFRCPRQICHNSTIRTLMEPQSAKCCSMFALQGCTFLSIFPWSPPGKISENGRFRFSSPNLS